MAGRRWPEAARIALLNPHPVAERLYGYLRVEDQGVGIARRYLPRLTERFFRVEREDNPEREGTGLGLAIVKHVMSRHRGGFLVESIAGQGSAFAVLAPLRRSKV
jgi:two-component system phosphate regulon sensor histidine kinase PhoR